MGKDIIVRSRSIFRRKRLSSKRVRRMWSSDEDEQLKYFVANHGSEDWGAIADGVQDRNRQQCWERWHYFLQPHLNTTEWSPEEDQELWNCVTEIGKKWAQIRKQCIPNRSADDIRSRWRILVRTSSALSGQK